jgi:hypothetical protein
MATATQTIATETAIEHPAALRWEVAQIVHVLQTLPIEKVIDVRDYVFFLQSRYGSEQLVDERDEWSDEDLVDATRLSMHYATQSLGLTDDHQ